MVQIVINGEKVEAQADPAMPLLWFLRDELGLTGTKFGCGQGLCRRLYHLSQWNCSSRLPNDGRRRRGRDRNNN